MRVTFLARRRALVITTVCGLAAAAVVATAALSSASPAGSAAVSTTFTVDLGKRGGAISDWGFDIKQASATKKVGTSQAYADQLFKNKKFTVLRIPMHTERGWVNADGTVRRIQYNNHAGDSNYVIDAIRKALTANPDLKLYANRMSIEGDEWVGHWYDGALKTNGRLSMSKYATFLADYVRFINSVADDFTTSSGQPARVRILGPDNEPKRKANEGDLTPVRFANLAAGVKSRLGTRTPQLIMNDDATADVDWLATAQRQFNPDAWQPLSYAGMHYQSLLRDVGSVREPFVQFSRRARLDSVNGSRKNLKAWDSEYHWDDSDGTGVRFKPGQVSKDPREFYVDSRAGVLGAIDHVDQGYTGVVWWSFGLCRESLTRHTCAGTEKNLAKKELHSALVDYTAGHAKVAVSDGDGSAAAKGTVTTRAFLAGSAVRLLIVNDTSSWLKDRRIDVKGKTVTAAPSIERWSRASDGTTGRSKAATGRLVNGDAVVTVPPRSIMVVRFGFR